jgi:hypothetical protein
MSADRYATPLRAVPRADESPAAASARLYAEAREKGRLAMESALIRLAAAENGLVDLAGLEAAPAGVRDAARRLAEQIAHGANNLASLMARK